MMTQFKSMTVFCGASKGINPNLFAPAYRLGEIIGENNMKLVFGIGDNGMMGMFDMFSGGSLSRMSVLALNIFPYI